MLFPPQRSSFSLLRRRLGVLLPPQRSSFSLLRRRLGVLLPPQPQCSRRSSSLVAAKTEGDCGLALLLLVRRSSYSPSNHNPDVPLPTQALLPTDTKPDDVVPLLLLPAILVQAPRIRLLVCLASEGLATQCYSLKTQSLNHTRTCVHALHANRLHHVTNGCARAVSWELCTVWGGEAARRGVACVGGAEGADRVDAVVK